MSSLMTNAAAMTALQTLRNVNANLASTQNRISTGYRVATASDNSAYWSIATTMKSDNVALSAVSDALGLGAATVDTMYTALESTVGDDKTGLTALKAKLVAAREPGVDRNKIQSEIDAIQEDLKNTADLAVFNGENWLSVDSSATGYNDTKSVVSSFSRANGVVSINTIDVGIDSVKLYDGTGVVGAAATGITAGGAGFNTTAAGAITVTVDTATPTVHTYNYAAGATLDSIVDGLNGLGIKDVTFVSTGTQIAFASRAWDDTLATPAGMDVELNASAAGLGAAVTAAGAGITQSDKAILDKRHDIYTGTAWTTSTVATFDISKLTDSAADLATLEQYISMVDDALAGVTQASANLGAVKTRIDSNSEFVKSLSDALDRGIGQLIDADMNAESTRLQALQVQQQLGIQALSIANSNSQNILSLFK
ncbi:flagellin [Xanthobacteraceae bacterium Astr-EGSB]|uniref:flagellin N-terminal helical domain-containing protein n=1 Tax=Astrobacterium formosum TaxID=3069710 RepID=UPI0027B36726|nr:flagellin [Xanthobacteraceae bacterium Astr-EGSB]